MLFICVFAWNMMSTRRRSLLGFVRVLSTVSMMIRAKSWLHHLFDGELPEEAISKGLSKT